MSISSITPEQDIERVHQVEAQRKTTALKIRDFSATPEEIEEWYRWHDPLKESRITRTIKSIRAIRTENKLARKASLHSVYMRQQEVDLDRKAALTLLYSIHFPDYFENGIIKKEIVEKLKQGETKKTQSHDLLSLVQELHDNTTTEKTQLTPKEISRLMIVGELLGNIAGSLFTRELYEDFPLTPKERNSIPFINGTSLDETNYQTASRLIYNVATLNSLTRYDEPQFTSLFIKSLLTEVADTSSFFEKSEPLRSEGMMTLLNIITELYDDGVFDKMDQGVLKGLMHQTIWAIDFLMLDYTENHGLKITPATLFEDWPYLNRPALERSFDIKIRDDFMTFFFELKSSPKAARGHHIHPAITLLTEDDNFSPEKSLIKDKLKLYKKYIKSGFKDKFRDDVNKQILGTVKEAVEHARQEREKLKDDPYFNMAFEIIEKSNNRAMRRCLGRRRFIEETGTSDNN